MFDINPPILISRVITLVIAFTCHEFAHAFTAVKLGDSTPRYDGRLSLNPLRHLDLWGSIMLIAAGFGWAKPVRVNSYAVTRKTKAGMMLVAAAGPFANFVLALIAATLLRTGRISNTHLFRMSWLPSPNYFLRLFMLTNLNLMIFNLIPLSPLDGEKVLDYFIPDSFRNTWQQIQRYGMPILMVCFVVLPYAGVNSLSDFIVNLSFSLYRLLLGV